MIYIAGIILAGILIGCFYYSKNGSKSLFTDNDDRASSLGITLAFAVSASKGVIKDCEFDLIKKWAGENIPEFSSDRKFHKALTATRSFFYSGNKINANGICSELVEITTLAQRYNIAELCMKVAAEDGTASAKELVFLRNLCQWLELDNTKFSMMMEAYVPVNIHEVKDAAFILGINNMMSPDDTRDKLNREYKKWNGRVTNPNMKIRSQAKLMIELITSVKNEHFSPGA